jgi:aminopeptidase-like protein
MDKNFSPIKKYFYLAKKKLFPLCRSITGYGISNTLKIIKKEFTSLKIFKFQSGQKIYDWVIPKQWEIKDAYLIYQNKKIIDFKKNNLHIVGYSYPINKKIKFKDLLKRLHSNISQPNAIPYVTSYYKKYWGFCISDKLKQELIHKHNKNDIFKVVIESKIKPGQLKYGELIIKGKEKQEILISTYICHPSMANNELSGPIVSMSLINYFIKNKPNKTLRFIFIPETIGSICFINKNLNYLKKYLIGGYNLTCIGDNKMHSCIFTKYKNTIADLSLKEAYKKLKIRPKIYQYSERGSDERQYNSPGVDLPIACICRSKFNTYPEYHTSFDNFHLVTLEGIMGGWQVAKNAIEILDNKVVPKARFLCEPFMEKRKLYKKTKNEKPNKLTRKIMNFLSYADGKNDIYLISKYLNIKIEETKKLYNLLLKKKLLYKY